VVRLALPKTTSQDALREVRMALLEADVALPVVKELIARVKEKAVGTGSARAR
jgi:signal recognition particle subunit SRP54